jgi:Copper type II ascorbate-dependent monooxygenase, C-terminal domain
MIRWTVVLIALHAVGFPGMGRAAAGGKTPTFARDVAPILFNNCLRCHGPERIASAVPLTSYEDVQSRAETIKDKVVTRQMPPWPADPAKSVKFRNDARLSAKDIDTIVDWVKGGTPKGEDVDQPAMPKSEEGWMHPQGLKPNLVISLPEDVHLPATGELAYKTFLIKLPAEEDQWVVASETRPSNPAVVHHMALTEVTLPNGMSLEEVDQFALATRYLGIPKPTIALTPAVTTSSQPDQIDMLGIYTPGSALEMYPEGCAKLLRRGKNMYLDFNVHYQTTGKPEVDRSKIAFWFQKGPPAHQLFRVNGAGETILANGRELLLDAPGTKAEGTHVAIPPIPAFAESYELVGVTAYSEPVTIYQLQPHAHYRGKDFTYLVVYPDGHEETLLSVPNYDHRWQMAYELETPVKLPAGSKLVVIAHYDNSKMNMHNHAPEKEVYFRDQNQSWDEMFTPFIQLSIDDQDPAKKSVALTGNERGEHGNASTQAEWKTGALEVGEVVGCLEGTSGGAWVLSHASEAAISQTQGTTSVALKAAEVEPLGGRRYPLLGTSVFKPADHRGEKVAVKGMLIKSSNDIGINVTSLQKVGPECAK